MKKVISENPEKAFVSGVEYALRMAGEILKEVVHQGANRTFLDYADEFNSVTVPDGYDQTDDPEGYIDFEAYRAPELLTPQAVEKALDAAGKAIREAVKDNYVPLDVDRFGKFAGKMLTDSIIPEDGAIDAHIASIVKDSVDSCEISWDEGIVINRKEKARPAAKPHP